MIVSAMFGDNKCMKTVLPTSNYGKNSGLASEAFTKVLFFFDSAYYFYTLTLFWGCSEHVEMRFGVDA